MCFYILLFLICTICYFRELLQTKKRQEETFERLNAVLGESCISCEIQPVGPEYEISQQVSPLPPSAEELFSSELSDNQNNTQALTPDSSRLKRTNINLDNSLSPGHSLLQIQCVDQKGLLYDIMRTLKDCSIQVSNSPILLPEFLWITLCICIIFGFQGTARDLNKSGLVLNCFQLYPVTKTKWQSTNFI